LAHPTIEEMHVLLVQNLRYKGYVLTKVDINGIAGVDPNDIPINLTWSEAEYLFVTIHCLTVRNYNQE
jgi:hypothetical protein